MLEQGCVSIVQLPYIKHSFFFPFFLISLYREGRKGRNWHVRERVGSNVHLLCLTLQIGVDERNVVIAADNISERRQALFYALDFHRVRQRIAQVLQFLICCGGGHEETVAVSWRIC